MCSAFNASKASIKVNFDAICQEENSMTVANANGLATIPTKVTKPIEMIKVIVFFLLHLFNGAQWLKFTQNVSFS